MPRPVRAPTWLLKLRERPRHLAAGALALVVVFFSCAVGSLCGGEPATLEVRTTPPGATVRLNGAQLEGTTPLVGVPLEEGEDYLVRAEIPGYEAQERSFTAHGGVHREPMVLRRRRVGLQFDAATPGLEVSVDSLPPCSVPCRVDGQVPGQTVQLVIRDADGHLATRAYVVAPEDPNRVLLEAPAVPPEPVDPSSMRRRRPRRRRPAIRRIQ